MKKNVMLKIASVLMIAVLLTTCAISSTFAKYVTTGATFSDTARVAKWGVTIDAKTTGLFAKTYETDDTETAIDTAVSAEVNVVAPGTTGTAGALYTVSGTPEVAIEVTRNFNIELTGWNINDGADEYCPLIITVNSVDYYVGKAAAGDDAAINSVDDLVKAVKTAVLGSNVTTVTEQFAPGKNVGELACLADISWRWDYDADPAVTVADKTDENDTKLGNWEINNVGAPTILITFSMTVTQID